MKILMFVTLLLPFFAIGQTNFKPGYVIVNSGDSLRGEIEEANWSLNPETIRFRDAKGIQSFGVRDIRGFGIDNETRFIRFPVTYQQTATDLNDADETFEGPVESRDILLRVLYKAKYSLYELGALKRRYYFIQTEDGDLKELIYRVRLNPSGVMEKDEQYKNLLNTLAIQEGKVDEVRQHISGMDYQGMDIMKVVSVLNSGAGSFRETGSLTTKIDVSGGPTIHIFNPSGNIFNDGSGGYAVYAADFKTSVGFTAGIGLTYYSKRNRGKIQSRLGVNISYLKIDGLNTTGAGSFQREEYKGSLIMAEPNISIDFRIGGDKQPVFLLGAVLGYNIVIGNDFKSTFQNPGVTIERKNFPPANGGFLITGLNATLLLSRSRLNLRGYLFSNIFDSPLTNLKGTGVSFTYGYFLKN